VRITARSSIDAYAFFDLFTDASMLNQVEAYLGCIVSDCFRRLRKRPSSSFTFDCSMGRQFPNPSSSTRINILPLNPGNLRCAPILSFLHACLGWC
jgi:hypothetical protein